MMFLLPRGPEYVIIPLQGPDDIMKSQTAISRSNSPAALQGEANKLQPGEDLGNLEDGKLPVQEVELEWLSTERSEPLQETVFLPEVHVEKVAFDVSKVEHLSDAAESALPPAERWSRSTLETMNDIMKSQTAISRSRKFPAALQGEANKLQPGEDLGNLEDGKLPVQEVELEWLSTERLEPLQETVFLPEVHVEKVAFDVSKVEHLSDAAESALPPARNLEMEENISPHQEDSEVQGIRILNCAYDFLLVIM